MKRVNIRCTYRAAENPRGAHNLIESDFMVELLRGGESVGQSTLTRFYSLHTFVMPWLLAVFMLMHFLMIRKQGISGPL